MASVKGPAPPPTNLDGSALRVAIVHSRWNKEVIDALVTGTVKKLREHGVKEHNIVVQSVPGSYELPLACSKCVHPGQLSDFTHIFAESSKAPMCWQELPRQTCSAA